jgi:hypothetical protein
VRDQPQRRLLLAHQEPPLSCDRAEGSRPLSGSLSL